MKTPEQKIKNREYMRNYAKIHPNKSSEWYKNHPNKKREHDKNYISKHLTEERKCIICGNTFRVIVTNSENPKTYRVIKTCSGKCRKIYYTQQQRKWQKEHPDRVREKVKEMIQNRKFSVMAIYSEGQPKCVCCDESEISFLTIDHINNDGSKQREEIFGKKYKRMGGYAFYSWIVKNNFPIDLQVLCANCQLGKKIEGVCPHQN